MYLLIILSAAAAITFVFSGIRIIRPVQRGLVETFGRATGYLKPGIHWRIPAVQRVNRVRFYEESLQLGMLRVITCDNLAILADAEITIALRDDRISVRSAVYSAGNYQDRVVSLAQTVLLDLIGAIPSDTLIIRRREISDNLLGALAPLAVPLGVVILRADLKEIEFPGEVRESILSVIKAQSEKRAAADLASAAKTVAEGMKRAEIKKAEAKKQALILEAEGNAKAIRLICETSRHYFAGGAQLMNVLVTALKGNAVYLEQPQDDGAPDAAPPPSDNLPE